MIDWPREVIIPLIAALLGILSGLGVAAKTLVPRLTEAFIATKQKEADDALAERKAKRDQQAEDEANERQTQIALLSQVVQLTMANQKLSDGLIKFITDRVDGAIQANQTEIRTKLDDIDKRWIAVSNKLDNPAILAGEISRLGDSVRELNTLVKAALNGKLKE